MTVDASRGFALDVNGLSNIARAERQQAGSGLKPVTQQFEAIFLNMMLKSMRASVPESSLYNSDALKTMGQMRDMQLSQAMSSRGIGVAEMLQQQLGGRQAAQGDPANAASLAALGIPMGQPRAINDIVAEAQAQHQFGVHNAPMEHVAAGQMAQAGHQRQDTASDSDRSSTVSSLWNIAREKLQAAPHVASFLARVGDSARRISAESGIPVRLIVAQAALETGWGRHDVKHEDGREGHNLFGIKAVGRYADASRATTTTEYEDGVASQRQERFRAYDSDEHAMRDYARMLTSHPRYSGIAGSTAHQGAVLLQQRGYATDPHYAEKLHSIINLLPEAMEVTAQERKQWHATSGASRTVVRQYASLEDDPSRIF